MKDNRKFIVDENLILRAAAVLSTASYATYDAATPKTIDLGGDGYTEGKLIIDVTTAATNWATVASGSVADFSLRGSNSATTFDDAYVTLARFRLGTKFAAESLKDAGHGGASQATASVASRYIVPWTNEFCGTCYRYLRLRIQFGGTGATGPTLGMLFLTK